MTDRQRLYYLDNLKVFLIILVIMHHVGQAYGYTGGVWYYVYPGERAKSLGLFFLFNASFFMGFFFFISGYFLPGSFDRRNARSFVADKLIRFGIPIAFAAFIIMPLLEYAKHLTYTGDIGFKEFYIHHWLGYVSGTAHCQSKFNLGYMWFIEHLLIYSILYAIMRVVLRKSVKATSDASVLRPALWVIVVYMVLLGFASYIVRESWGLPINRWIWFLGFMQMEPAHMPQYASLFVIGILSYRYSFLESFTTPRNILWFVPAIGIYVQTVISIYTTDRKHALFAWEFKEALFCVGICIGFLALFKTFFNRTGHIMKILSENSFGAYIFHIPIVVALQYAFDPVKAGAFTLFAVISLLSIPASFFASYLVRLIPGMKRVL